MKIEIHKSNERGFFDHDWLKTNHSFSFAEYQNPERQGFGKLLVLNDDSVMPGSGFDFHPHRNMEIISIPLSGTLLHKDSFNNEQAVKPGEVQLMSAGTGIMHSEFNASDKEQLNFLQLWIAPDKLEIRPRYGIATYTKESLKNNFRLIASPETSDDSLSINQDCHLYLADIDKDNKPEYKLTNPKYGVYVFVIEGSIEIEKSVLFSRDAAAVSGCSSFRIRARQNCSLLLIEVPL